MTYRNVLNRNQPLHALIIGIYDQLAPSAGRRLLVDLMEAGYLASQGLHIPPGPEPEEFCRLFSPAIIKGYSSKTVASAEQPNGSARPGIYKRIPGLRQILDSSIPLQAKIELTCSSMAKGSANSFLICLLELGVVFRSGRALKSLQSKESDGSEGSNASDSGQELPAESLKRGRGRPKKTGAPLEDDDNFFDKTKEQSGSDQAADRSTQPLQASRDVPTNQGQNDAVVPTFPGRMNDSNQLNDRPPKENSTSLATENGENGPPPQALPQTGRFLEGLMVGDEYDHLDN